jgi:hypothetical protein
MLQPIMDTQPYPHNFKTYPVTAYMHCAHPLETKSFGGSPLTWAASLFLARSRAQDGTAGASWVGAYRNT